MAFFLQRRQRPGDVMRGERAAVMEFRFRPQQESIGEPVVRNAHGARGQAIHGVGLVAGRNHQRGEGEPHPQHTIALEDVAVERIECEEGAVKAAAADDFGIAPAFRRVGIDVFEMREIGGIAEIAEGRHAVTFGILRRSRRDEFCSRNRAGRQDKRMPPCNHERRGTAAALSLSHHQMLGNAAAPYFGMVCGRPKRSQRAVRCLP